jgi:hypothetical protein
LSNRSGIERVKLSPEEFGRLIESDLEHWTKVIDAVGARIE